MNSPPTASSRWLAPFISVLEQAGTPIDRLLGQAQLPYLARERTDLVLAEPALWVFVGLAAETGDLRGLGFLAARHSGIESQPEFCRRIDKTPSLTTLIKTFAAESPVSDFRVQRMEGGVYFTRRGSGFESGSWQVEQYIVTTMIQAVQRIVGPEWSPDEVRLQARLPGGVEDSLYFDGSNAVFGQSRTAIRIPELLVVGATEPLLGERSNLIEADWTLLSQVLEPYFAEGYPDELLAAEICGTAVRTLRRRLKEAGTSYREIVGATRLNIARRMLAEPGIRLIDIAYSLGYQDQGSFTRAFRTWTGMSPSAFRRGHQYNDK